MHQSGRHILTRIYRVRRSFNFSRAVVITELNTAILTIIRRGCCVATQSNNRVIESNDRAINSCRCSIDNQISSNSKIGRSGYISSNTKSACNGSIAVISINSKLIYCTTSLNLEELVICSDSKVVMSYQSTTDICRVIKIQSTSKFCSTIDSCSTTNSKVLTNTSTTSETECTICSVRYQSEFAECFL